MTDPIKAALGAAQGQASSFYSLAETAGIVAAFLRDLPDAGFRITVRLDGGTPLDLDCEVPDKDLIAAAVEAAARGDV